MLRMQLVRSGSISGSLVLWFFLATMATLCPAAPIPYGPIGPIAPGITFTNIVESSATDTPPLYGPPTGFVIGLDFQPTAFASSATNGSVDITDGQLNFTVEGSDAFPINSIGLSEKGDFSLGISGSAATAVAASAVVLATVTQVNGIDVAPFDLLPVNASLTYNLAANPGFGQFWSLGLTLDIAGQMAPNQRATKVNVAIDNTLASVSQTGTIAFIAKKGFRINIGTNEVPEVGTMLLALVGGTIIGASARRNRRSVTHKP